MTTDNPSHWQPGKGPAIGPEGQHTAYKPVASKGVSETVITALIEERDRLQVENAKLRKENARLKDERLAQFAAGVVGYVFSDAQPEDSFALVAERVMLQARALLAAFLEGE